MQKIISKDLRLYMQLKMEEPLLLATYSILALILMIMIRHKTRLYIMQPLSDFMNASIC
jgi:hypothetical protein